MAERKMKVSGIICEYNPFHNGHLHHIRETRKNSENRYGATHVVAVMSGNFVQRGDTAVIDKLERAKLAIRSGADLVIELPVQYCLSSAQNYAEGAVWLLENLGVVDELSFGSECGSIQDLSNALDVVEYVGRNKADEIRSIMEKGYTFPRAISSIIDGIDENVSAIVKQPNNMLAIEYLRAIKKFAPNMSAFTVKRESSVHDGDEVNDNNASASYIRNKIESGCDISEISPLTTSIWVDALQKAKDNKELSSITRLERILLYKLRSTAPEDMTCINDIGQGLEYRIHDARMSGSLDEVMFKIKTKRYTMARIRRILLSLLIGIRKDDMDNLPPYGRILAFNERGKEILAAAKGKARLPYATSIAKLSQTSEAAKRFAELEMSASNLYGLSLEKINSADKDYRAKIVIDLE